MVRLSLLWGWLALLSAASAWSQSEAEVAETASRFERTVAALQGAPEELRADFAGIALLELSEACVAEADLARSEVERQGGNAKLSGWARAVDQYAGRLMLLLDDLDAGFPVSLSQPRRATVGVSVADRMVILSHPRADQQAGFEQRILQDFCSRHDCGALTAAVDPPQPIPVSAGAVRPDWTFTGDGPLCRYQGIELRFSSADNLGRSRDICARLLQEALTLGNEIAWQRRHGVAVEWGVLETRPTPGRPEHLVVLNRAGDSILATLPLVHSSPGLLRDLLPWLRNRFSGEPQMTLRLQAGRYGWE